MSEEGFEAQLLNMIKVISKYYEEFELFVKPVSIDVRIERDELDYDELQTLMRVLDELNDLGLEAKLTISAILEEGEPIVRVLISTALRL
ncbi:MAG: hypothetical protein J7L11_05360 [Thermoprotei archaeon]|nr:hypothetical protein [Thermoprotei archaeon]